MNQQIINENIDYKHKKEQNKQEVIDVWDNVLQLLEFIATTIRRLKQERKYTQKMSI